MKTLAQILNDAAAPVVTAFKIDIEGHEDRALLPWLHSLPDERLPRFGILEICHSDHWREDLLGTLQKRGYTTVHRDKGNVMVERR